MVGTNFQGTSNAMTRMYNKNMHQELQRYFRPRRISWHFNTPSASSQGGAWERLIRSVRRLLSNLPIDPQNVAAKPDHLRTMLAGAQKILNARPLTPIRANPHDCDAVTPSSLIHHHSINPVNHIGALPSRESLLRNYRHVQDRVDIFWNKWLLMYMHYLQKRHAQRMTQKNLEVGNLVLIIDHPTPRGQYPLARVVEVFPDHEGHVRRVRVITANSNKLNPHLPCSRSTFERDTTKLALLEFPAVNPISELLCEPESEVVTDNTHTHTPDDTPTLDVNTNTLSPEQNSSGSTCK